MQIGENILLKTLNELPEVAKKVVDNLKLKEPKVGENCLAFYGEMGAGKTTLIKAICMELGVGDTTSSPTFSIINEYIAESGKPIFHFDFYRINNESEAYDFGYEEYFYSGELCLIEWPEKIANLLPTPYYKLQITVNESDHRIIQMFYEE